MWPPKRPRYTLVCVYRNRATHWAGRTIYHHFVRILEEGSCVLQLTTTDWRPYNPTTRTPQAHFYYFSIKPHVHVLSQSSNTIKRGIFPSGFGFKEFQALFHHRVWVVYQYRWKWSFPLALLRWPQCTKQVLTSLWGPQMYLHNVAWRMHWRYKRTFSGEEDQFHGGLLQKNFWLTLFQVLSLFNPSLRSSNPSQIWE